MNFTRYNAGVAVPTYDIGLRAYMQQVFNLMALALVVTGITASYASTDAFMSMIISERGMTPFGYLVQLSPLFIVIFLSFKIGSMSASTAKITFGVYSIAMGLSMGLLFHQYTGESIARTFFVSASIFGAMSIYGYTTKKDLTGFGSFLMMGLMGIVIASLVNIFMHSSAINFTVSILGVLIFTGLTAYDVQKIKSIYFMASRMDKETTSKLAIQGALTLYLDFINLFIMLLRFMGNSRRD